MTASDPIREKGGCYGGGVYVFPTWCGSLQSRAFADSAGNKLTTTPCSQSITCMSSFGAHHGQEQEKTKSISSDCCMHTALQDEYSKVCDILLAALSKTRSRSPDLAVQVLLVYTQKLLLLFFAFFARLFSVSELSSGRTIPKHPLKQVQSGQFGVRVWGVKLLSQRHSIKRIRADEKAFCEILCNLLKNFRAYNPQSLRRRVTLLEHNRTRSRRTF